MHTNSLIKRLLKIEKIAIENVYFENNIEEEIMVIRVRPFSREQNRCPICGKKCSGYDSSDKVRRWRSLDFGSTRVCIEACSPRIKCENHGIKTARVPWARHDSDYTKDFEQAVTWSVLHMTATDVSEYFRIEWHTVGRIALRVQKELEATKPSRFEDLVRIGIDETSYKKGHKYMTVVVNHDTGTLIWAKKNHGKEVLTEFFKELTAEQRANIKLVSGDGARWITDCVKEFCPNAERCVDPFHVVGWATEALDNVRKSVIKASKIKAADDETALPVKKNAEERLAGKRKNSKIRTLKKS